MNDTILALDLPSGAHHSDLNVIPEYMSCGGREPGQECDDIYCAGTIDHCFHLGSMDRPSQAAASYTTAIAVIAIVHIISLINIFLMITEFK